MRNLLAAVLITVPYIAVAQNPVEWSFSATKVNDKTYEVHLTASVQGPWHIYSQYTPEGGPVATSISFNKNPLLITEGAVKENGKLEQHHEPLFGVDVKQFSGKVDFVQTIQLKSKVRTSLGGTITFMLCNDWQCLPPKTINFKIPVP